ncbi:maleate cis-trans isomerase family protein [Antarcticimicrobium sediminis]|uniref:Asp/Glu racemase n=1 Tax=Antarcticimicrobium sediminis TaxID=2546227 RepID=A0A4R5EU15_9RHOB|nr:aspartate/glutamate racemase family protein [Antarcticimicrobium sediminis]TDE38293.1 Asp/Glu racemase [Antarcticimicrobium sediminis]
MQVFSFDTEPRSRPTLGLVALQVDERIEADFRQLLPASVDLMVTRIPSGRDVTPQTLAQMEADLPQAAALLPGTVDFDVIGYGCTSGAAQIGPDRVASGLRNGARCTHVSEPVSALVAACRALGLHRLALLSPYVDTVSERLRAVLSHHGIETPVFGSFNEAEEARVARITPGSVARAARALAPAAPVSPVDALFLSCTNLNTLPVVPTLEREIGLPVLSSNLVLAWHMLRLSGASGLTLDCVLTSPSRKAALT